jgi:hypothetical protein
MQQEMYIQRTRPLVCPPMIVLGLSLPRVVYGDSLAMSLFRLALVLHLMLHPLDTCRLGLLNP